MRKFNGEEGSGMSVFYKDGNGEIYNTYSAFGRGNEQLLTTYIFLDMTPKGRYETNDLTDWVKHHDMYEKGGYVDPNGRYQKEEIAGACCSANKA